MMFESFFDKIANLDKSKLFNLFIFICFFLSFSYYLRFSYSDHDVIIYTLIGKAIYQQGIMPYSFAFDHKPFLTYIFYGLLAPFQSFPYNRYTIFSVFMILMTVLMIRKLSIERGLSILFSIFLVGMASHRTISYSGNTEYICMFFSVFSVLLLIYKKNIWGVIFSSVLSCVAFNVNYMVAVLLFPSVFVAIYMVSINFVDFIKRLSIFSCVFLFSFSGIVCLISLGNGNVVSYFTLQYKFLHGYGGSRRAPSLYFLVVCFCCLLSTVLPWIPAVRPSSEALQRCKAMSVMIFFSMIAFMMNGKYSSHYLYMATLPACVIMMALNYKSNKSKVVFNVFLIMSAFVMCKNQISNYVYSYNSYENPFVFYKNLSFLTKEKKVLSYHMSVVPLYYSDAIPFQPFVWDDHAKLIYGQDEKRYFLAMLNKKPPFVMTQDHSCTSSGSGDVFCQELKKNYILIQNKNTPDKNPNSFYIPYTPGYDLYKIQ